MPETLQNSTPFKWDNRREKAAKLLAADELTDEQIASECKRSRDWLMDLKRHPEFQARIEEHVQAFRRRVMARGFVRREKRLDTLNTLAVDTLQALQDANYERTEVKVAATGQRIEFDVFDKARVDTVRGCLDDIARELGERRTSQQNLNIDLDSLTDVQLQRIADGEDPLQVMAGA